MEGIQVSIEKVGPRQNIAVIKVGGYIDTTTSAELERALSSVIKSDCYNIVIDLANVDYISSAGWGIFISEIKGIREHNGDLKLVAMIPDVYEVFELLEFHYILKAFNTLEEAVNDFSGANALKVPPRRSDQRGTQQQEQHRSAPVDKNEMIGVVDRSNKQQPKVNAHSLDDKIRQIVYENPQYGTMQIIRTLNSQRFGNIKVGWFEMRRYLKKLSLGSKKKRSEYFRERTMG